MQRPIRPFFSYFGAKWRASGHLPAPYYETIVEPFAVSAGYSLRHPDRRVILVDKDPTICGVWRYLIRTPAAEIRALPLLESGAKVSDLHVCPEARALIGFNVNRGAAAPRNSLSTWATKHPDNVWGAHLRERIATSVDRIRHWQIIEGSYETAPSVEAMWIVDPPYQIAGVHYRYGATGIDFRALGEWCRTRPGVCIVHEAAGADWLDFSPWRDVKAQTYAAGVGRVSSEVLAAFVDGERVTYP